MAAALGALDAADTGAASGLAWVVVAVAVSLVALGIAVRASGPVHSAIALLGLMLLLRHGSRLVLAPPYGAGLLLIAELAFRSSELREVSLIGPGVLGRRVASLAALFGLSVCVAAVVAIAASAAPGRSVALTIAGALIALAAFAMLLRYAWRRYERT